MAEVKLTGLKEAAAALRALPAEIASKNGGPLRGALYAATRVIKDQAIQNAPTGEGTPLPGNLKKNIIAIRDRNPARSGAAERYVITVRNKRMARGSNPLFRVLKGWDAWYAHFTEFGTSKQPAQRWMTRAYEEKKQEALAIFERTLAAGLDKAAERARRKSGGK